MLPVPESAWASHFVVPVQEVKDIVSTALRAHYIDDGKL